MILFGVAAKKKFIFHFMRSVLAMPTSLLWTEMDIVRSFGYLKLKG